MLDYLESLGQARSSSHRRARIGVARCTDALAEDVRPEAVVAVAAAFLGSADPKPGIEFLKGQIELVNREREVNLPVRPVEAIALLHAALPQPKSAARN